MALASPGSTARREAGSRSSTSTDVFVGARRLDEHTAFEGLQDALIIAIDVPIGFGPRAADAAARRYPRGAASTVFTTPSRAQLEAAWTAHRIALGVACSLPDEPEVVDGLRVAIWY